jgi:hypothetical protein
MAEGETDRLTLLNWPTLVVFVLLSWGIVLSPPTMKSLRPTGEPAQATGPPVGQVFESRLWQDPFDSLLAARKASAELQNLQQAFFNDRKSDEGILILPVFLPGSPYPEDVETRLRSRYAVVSALAVSGYIPEDGGDIRCFTTSWPIGVRNSLLHALGGLFGLGSGAPNPPNSAVFPYEWFKYVPPGGDPGSYQKSLTELTHIRDPVAKLPKRIAVIWVDELLFDESRVGRGPATLLKEWARQLMKLPDVDLATLGPQSSTTLRALLSEPKPKCQSCQAVADKIKIYSFASTAAALRTPWKQELRQADDFDIEHVIGTDRELACKLVHELELRGIEASPDEATVAVVAEWDTFYSQSMVNAFSKAFQGGQIRFFTYQQGIDGRLPRDRAPDAAGSGKGATSDSVLPGGEPLVSAPEVQSFGRSQIDYLQRLVDQMKRTGPTGWKAIGVLGSDFYDKALILQTLKHEFPEAVFFTTDLDQRFLDPAEHKTTRNLLVASHFGLKLHYGLQRAIPPFRSVYQTALFFGCLKALHARGVPRPWMPADKEFPKAFQNIHVDDHSLVCSTSAGPPLDDPLCIKWKPDAGNTEPKLRPMVFEIGLSRAYPLTDPGPEEIHPATYRRTDSFVLKEVFKEVFGVVVCLVIGLLALAAISLGLPPKNKVDLWFVLWVICAVLAVAAMVFLAIHDHQDYEGEPFTLLEGISNWPTLVLRMGVVLFCTFALVHARKADQENANELEQQFWGKKNNSAGTQSTHSSETAAEQPKKTLERLLDWLKAQGMIDWKAVLDTHKPEAFWDSTKRCIEKHWFERILVVIMFCLLFCLLSAIGLAAVRGAVRLPEEYPAGLARLAAGLAAVGGAVRLPEGWYGWLIVFAGLWAISVSIISGLFYVLATYGAKPAIVLGTLITVVLLCWLCSHLPDGWAGSLTSSLGTWALIVLILVILGCFVAATDSIGLSVAAQIGWYVLFCVGLLRLFPAPNQPHRGALNILASEIVLVAAGLLSVALLWYVIHATRLTIKLGEVIVKEGPDWPVQTLKETAADLAIDPGLVLSSGSTINLALERSLKQLVNVQFLARRTTVLEGLIYEAAFAYLLLFLSRNPFFDQYVMSRSLILTFTVALLGVLGSATWLRFAARKARQMAQENVRDRLKELRLDYSMAYDREPPRAAAEALEKIAQTVADVKTGAFSSLGDDPVLHTLLMILGGIGTLLSLEPIQQLLR